MPWNENDYPDSFKNLNEEVREMAIEIANALVREGYDEGRSIAIATSKAREYVHGNDPTRPQYDVKSVEDDWVLIEKDSGRALFKGNRKKDLLERVKPFVNEQNGILAVYHEDGTFEDRLYE